MQNYHSVANVRQESLKYGLILAAVNIFVFLLVYYVKPDLMISTAYAIVSFFISLGLIIYFTLELRKKAGGYWSFKEALSNIFIVLIVSGVIAYFFNVLFGKFIEPQYVEFMKNAMYEKFENSALSQEQRDNIVDEVGKQFNPGMGGIIKALAISVLAYFVEALILAAIFKKNRPFEHVIAEGEAL